MIIKIPNQKKGTRVEGLFADCIEILPTVLDICNMSPKPGSTT